MKLLDRLGKLFNFSPTYLEAFMVSKPRNDEMIDLIFARYLFTMWRKRI